MILLKKINKKNKIVDLILLQKILKKIKIFFKLQVKTLNEYIKILGGGMPFLSNPIFGGGDLMQRM